MTMTTPRAHTHKSHPETSFLAAESVTNITELQRRIIQVFEEYGEMTHERLIVNYRKMWGNIHKDTDSGIRSRCSQLEVAGYIVKDKGAGMTVAGCKANIYRLAGLLW